MGNYVTRKLKKKNKTHINYLREMIILRDTPCILSHTLHVSVCVHTNRMFIVLLLPAWRRSFIILLQNGFVSILRSRARIRRGRSGV